MMARSARNLQLAFTLYPLALAASVTAFASASLANASTKAPPSYAANCQSCHKLDGSGVTGVFPRLSGRMGGAAQLPAGRKWLIANAIFGQSGEITVDGRSIRGAMPSLGRLSDAQVAEALNWLVSGQGQPFTAAEVAAVRSQPGLNAAKVGQMRAELARAGVIK